MVGVRGDSVLVTSGDHAASRAAVAAVWGLVAAGYRAAVTVSGTRSLAAASRHCARRIDVPSVSTHPSAYASAVRAELKRGSYLAVLPITEAVLLALDMPVRRLISKIESGAAAKQAGLEVPPTQVFESFEHLRADAESLIYPAVVKPEIKVRPAFRVDAPADVVAQPSVQGRFVVQPYLGDQLHGVLGLMWRGKLVSSVHMRYERIWPVGCGTIAAGETIPADRQIDRGLERLLEGYDGIFHADFAGPYLLDLNPRVHATLPLGAKAGVNLVGLYCDLLRGQSVDPAPARPGIFYRWIEGDIRSVLANVRSGKMNSIAGLRALAPRRNTVHSFEAVRDFGPLLTRMLQIGRNIVGASRGNARRTVSQMPERPIP